MNFIRSGKARVLGPARLAALFDLDVAFRRRGEFKWMFGFFRFAVAVVISDRASYVEILGGAGQTALRVARHGRAGERVRPSGRRLARAILARCHSILDARSPVILLTTPVMTGCPTGGSAPAGSSFRRARPARGSTSRVIGPWGGARGVSWAGLR